MNVKDQVIKEAEEEDETHNVGDLNVILDSFITNTSDQMEIPSLPFSFALWEYLTMGMALGWSDPVSHCLAERGMSRAIANNFDQSEEFKE